MTVLLFVLLFAGLFLGLPVGVALLGSSILFFVVEGLPELTVLQRMIGGLDSFPVLAVPFFILAGSLMNAVSVTDRIFDFALACVGWLRGGLGHVNVAASVIFSGMSGAAVADAGGMGSIEIKAMRDAGYDDRFAIGITAASSVIGPLIPPSLPMIFYGVVASESIGRLFMAGVVPGLLTALMLSLMVVVISKRRGYGRDRSFAWIALVHSFRRAFLSLLTPVIIIGGIVSGMVTPTEAAIAAVFYTLFLGLVVYRNLTMKKLASVMLETVEATGSVMFVVASATVFAWILTANHLTEQLAGLLLSIADNKIAILLIINLILLIVGCFLETIAAITILVPVLLPIAVQFGVSPEHFGVIVVFNLMIGLLTPPIGMVLFVLSRVAQVPFERAVAGTIPFFIPLFIVLAVITFVPAVSTWLPGVIYGP
ncbi:TRAP transporter large permease [Nitratireductor pacificus]|uniref:TRAP transporter large permease protein n=1 Tax=Nitratireductor pacificus pht-3B TaxID=391937 RepID=K2MIB2_9HYPH|nr:TRAP transporter large permease [Nitratireductor pacificus]EKF20450.1 TRAP dicarboxylate transporter subunit DctM [Nitratireductor pacificus pht-3B]